MNEAQNNNDLMILSADLGITSGLSKYIEKFPEKFLNVGIAEQNMIGVATGMSIKGYRVFATSFAPFATARCLEQIKVNMGEMKIPIVIVGIASGFEMEYFGNSHYGYDDIASVRSISGLTILSPADTTELAMMLEILKTYISPIYLRLTKTSKKDLIYHEDFKFQIGKFNVLKPYGKITILATGSIVSTALKVANRIEQENFIKCGVVDAHTIKPIDIDTIKEINTCSNLIVSLEEHNIIGGLGSAISEILSSIGISAHLLMIGINDIHNHIGDYDFMIKSYELDSDSVYKKIISKWEEVEGYKNDMGF